MSIRVAGEVVRVEIDHPRELESLELPSNTCRLEIIERGLTQVPDAEEERTVDLISGLVLL